MENTKPMSHVSPAVRTPEGAWTFLTNHTHVMLCLYRDSGARLRDVAQVVGITERACQRIVADLEAYGAVTRVREGRRNRYEIDLQVPLRHSLESHRTIGDLLRAVTEWEASGVA